MLPLHPPLAVQLVPEFDDQVTTADSPRMIWVGFTDMFTVAAGGAEEPPFPPPPQAVTIKAHRIPDTMPDAARFVCTI
jgi:hypothetical protein